MRELARGLALGPVLLHRDRVLDVVREVLEELDHVEVAVDDLVEHQVQEETDPLFGQGGSALEPGRHLGEVELGSRRIAAT